MKNNNFIEVNFCLECKHYKECKESKWGIDILEKYMIFSALKSEEKDIQEKFNDIFKNKNFSNQEIKEFIENKKKNCIYFPNEI